jgi:hypothetical protein
VRDVAALLITLATIAGVASRAIVLMIQLLPNTTDIREKFPTLYPALTGAAVAGAETRAGR